MIVIRLNSGEARNRLNAIAAVIEHPADMLAESGDRVEHTLKAHFLTRDRTGNKLGGRRSHFWAQMEKATARQEATDQSVDIDIGDGRFAQKLYGGTIQAKTPWPFSGFMLLTIPVHPAAYNTKAKDLKRNLGIKLTFVGSARGGVLGHFAEHVGRVSTDKAEGVIYYVCVPEVTQQADPDALPAGDVLEREALQGAEDYLRTEVQAAQTGESQP